MVAVMSVSGATGAAAGDPAPPSGWPPAAPSGWGYLGPPDPSGPAAPGGNTGWVPSASPVPGSAPGGAAGWGQPPAPLPGSAPARAGAPAPSLWERFVRRFHDAPVTVSIVVFTVAVWLVHEALITWAGINTDLTLGDPGSAIHGQPWRLLTPLVVHFGILHIGLNMFALWQIGPPVEKVIGRGVYLASYLVAGAGGQIVSDLYFQWHPAHQSGQVVTVLSGGASGAIFGVVGLLIGNHVVTSMAEKSGRRSRQQWRFTPSAAKSLAIQGTIWIIFTSIAIPGIDNWAHLGGVAVGLFIGGAIAWGRTEPATTHA